MMIIVVKSTCMPCLLGVPAMSQILTGGSQKFKFSTRTSSAHVACCPADTWAGWAEVARLRGVSYDDRIYIFEILMKIVRNITHPAKSDELFFESGHPYCLL